MSTPSRINKTHVAGKEVNIMQASLSLSLSPICASLVLVGTFLHLMQYPGISPSPSQVSGFSTNLINLLSHHTNGTLPPPILPRCNLLVGIHRSIDRLPKKECPGEATLPTSQIWHPKGDQAAME